MEAAFEAATSEKRILHKAAVILHLQIQAAWLTSPHLPWPPKACDLLNSAPTPPSELCDFLHQTITGRQGSIVSDRVRRVGASLAADICVAATNGKWIMPKHLLLSMALRHLTGSAQVLTIINRFGHCQPYTKVLEIETTIGTLIQTRTVCCHQTFHGVATLLHSCVRITLTSQNRRVVVLVQRTQRVELRYRKLRFLQLKCLTDCLFLGPGNEV